MTVYLDIGVVYIQSWLTRTTKLRGRRGGSAMISEATAPDVVDGVIDGMRDKVVRNDEAGDIDGVVALKLLVDDDDVGRQVEQIVVGHLRGKLPTATLRAGQYIGENYAAARLNRAKWENTWSPAVSDWPPGKPCEWCYSWPATPNDADEENSRLCGECALRKAKAIDAEEGKPAPRQEKELLSRLDTATRVPNMMKDLAKLSGDGTHVALIYADGNAIGKFIGDLHRMRREKRARELLERVTKVIDESTWQALVAAVGEIWDGDTAPPMIPHLVGGDDVLVSVPADQAWAFVRTLQSEFSRVIRHATEGTGVTPPSLSAGIVFHHYIKPLHVMHDLVSTLLRSAKTEYHGAEAAIAWQDATRDGEEPIDRTPFRHAKLETETPKLAELAALPNAARQRLAELLRSHELGTKPVEQHLRRLGLAGKVATFREDPILLADALGMVRWWRR
ncbi:Cas10/Cmr2 second palm domain-containing protein [Saccharopolyspora hattusasensis]|uniref:Cas10/Cmr2 second palm domain-containing protein n=1 Tax=Saccharopolyspora hattusasensis TaxID=1128679 RepID=UPI003D967C50